MNGIKIFSALFMLALLPGMTVALQAAEGQDKNKAEREFARPLPDVDFPDIHPLPSPAIDEYMLALAEDQGDRDRDRNLHRHAERIQLFRLWKLMEDVELTDDQVDKFFPLMREYGKQERELAGQRRELLHTLREELDKENPSDAKLTETLASLKANSSKIVESKNKAIDDASKILNVRQQARLALSLHEVERNIWESIARVRHLGESDFRDLNFDKQKLQMNMQQLRENLQRISQELEAKGLPGLDINAEMRDNDRDMDKDTGKDKDNDKQK